VPPSRTGGGKKRREIKRRDITSSTVTCRRGGDKGGKKTKGEKALPSFRSGKRGESEKKDSFPIVKGKKVEKREEGGSRSFPP